MNWGVMEDTRCLRACPSPWSPTLDEDVEAILIEEGFELVVADLNTQLVSFCGDDMNVLDAAGNEYSLQYDGTGYINGFFGSYFAPAENFELGCGLETACNYNPCALAVDSLCSEMVGILSTNNATGFLSLDMEGGIPRTTLNCWTVTSTPPASMVELEMHPLHGMACPTAPTVWKSPMEWGAWRCFATAWGLRTACTTSSTWNGNCSPDTGVLQVQARGGPAMPTAIFDLSPDMGLDPNCHNGGRSKQGATACNSNPTASYTHATCVG